MEAKLDLGTEAFVDANGKEISSFSADKNDAVTVLAFWTSNEAYSGRGDVMIHSGT